MNEYECKYFWEPVEPLNLNPGDIVIINGQEYEYVTKTIGIIK